MRNPDNGGVPIDWGRKRKTDKAEQSEKEAQDGEGSARRRRKRRTEKEAQDGERSARRSRNRNPLKRRRSLDGAPTMGKALHGQALGEVVERLQHPYGGVRLHALEQLVWIVGGYAPAVLALTALLENQDWRVRRAAVDALSEISVTVVRELTRRMVHQDKDVRIAWLQALSPSSPDWFSHALCSSLGQ